jgi:tryptophan synthase alpha chain
MSLIDQLFRDLKSAGKKAFMPFVTAGDPDLDFTAAVLAEVASRGGHLIELGIPYSDPIADGPVIQASYTRALEHGITLPNIFSMMQQTVPSLPTPVVTMVSYAIVLRQGLANYVGQAKAAGASGLIVPDLPVEESDELAEICQAADISLIQLVTPTTPQDRALRIAEASAGFLYYVSVVGITGERQELPSELIDNVGWLREQTTLPICIGFGISTPEHVRKLAPVADGLIVGSAVVRRIAACGEKSHDEVIREVGDYCESLLTALNNS